MTLKQTGSFRSPKTLTITTILVAGLVSGCGAATQRPPQAVETVAMEPVRVTARQPDAEGDVVIEAYDARDLLRRGNEALSGGQCEAALAAYDQLVAEFPSSRMVSAAHYNAALCLGRTGDTGAAVERYLRLVGENPDSSDVTDSLFQAARGYEELERWADAVGIFDRILEITDLSPDERLEAMTRRGSVLVRLNRLTDGEVQLRRTIAYYHRQKTNAIRTDYYLAQAQYYLGEGPRAAMAEVELTNDEAQFRQALERRCELLLEAQVQYVQAIRVGNAHWGAASAYRIGQMYSSLYDDVMAVPVPTAEPPPDLTAPEEIEAFRDEFPRHYRRLLREYLAPLLHNAIRWWESNLMMVERTGVRGAWVERTRRNLGRVQELLEEAEGSEDSPETPSTGSDPSASGSNTEDSENTED